MAINDWIRSLGGAGAAENARRVIEHDRAVSDYVARECARIGRSPGRRRRRRRAA